MAIIVVIMPHYCMTTPAILGIAPRMGTVWFRGLPKGPTATLPLLPSQCPRQPAMMDATASTGWAQLGSYHPKTGAQWFLVDLLPKGKR